MKRRLLSAGLLLAACLTAPGVRSGTRLLQAGVDPTALAAEAVVRTGDLPARLSDREFWRLITDSSEAGGYFQSDNFVSNETLLQTVIPDLTRRMGPGGVYLGVGPDQNFTYVVALEPRLAFIVDIRRQNLLEHLMYKAVLELSSTRADFLSRLFSRKRPSGLGPRSTPLELLEASFNAMPSQTLYQANLQAVLDHLEKTHGFPLSNEDEEGIAYVYGTFFTAGPAITYSFGAQAGRSFGRGFGRGMPNYADLMLGTDGHGTNRSYLSTEERFQALQTIERDNRLVPLVGNFAGDRALRAVGRYLKERGGVVTAFYLSNVEQYLFQDASSWRRFYDNVATLPLDETSTFVRSCFQGQGCGPLQSRNFTGFGGPIRSAQLLQPISALLRAVSAGQVSSYSDVIARSR